MLRRWVEPFTRSVGRLADPTAGYSQRKRKVKPVTIVTFTEPDMTQSSPARSAGSAANSRVYSAEDAYYIRWTPGNEHEHPSPPAR